MRLIEHPERPPGTCCVIPGRAQDPEGFIDTGNDMPIVEPHIYVSVAAVREMAREVGLPTAEEHADACAQRDELDARVAELERECNQLQTALDATEIVQSYARRSQPRTSHQEAA